MAKSSLAYSHRLPKALRDMLQPIYSMDGITLDGRDGAADDPDKKAGGLGDAFKAIWRATEGLFLILHNREGDGKRSATEVKIIEQLLQAKGPWTDEEAVGIIASHKMQRADLNKALDSDKLAKTVDEFQVSSICRLKQARPDQISDVFACVQAASCALLMTCVPSVLHIHTELYLHTA